MQLPVSYCTFPTPTQWSFDGHSTVFGLHQSEGAAEGREHTLSKHEEARASTRSAVADGGRGCRGRRGVVVRRL